MKNRVLVLGLILVAVVATGAFWFFSKDKEEGQNVSQGQSVVSDEPDTGKADETGDFVSARRAYFIALKGADEWDSDVKLLQINDFLGTSRKDGLSPRWRVLFFFGSKNKAYEVNVFHGKILGQNDSKAKNLEPISNKWIDSDKAMMEASKHFSGLSCQKYEQKLSGNVWQVKCFTSKTEYTTVSIDALTGKFIDID